MNLRAKIEAANREAGGRIAATAQVAAEAQIEFPIDVADHATVYGGATIGKFSYLNVGCVLYGRSSIGRYCSVGRQVEVGLARHPVNFLSTHPFQVARSLFMGHPEYAAVRRKPWRFHEPTTVENDVWIGAKACIAGGVTIGSGAIVAAGAVVTQDVPPYAIVGGVPARVIRFRFPPGIVQRLLSLRWWDLPLDQVGQLPFDDINACLAEIEKIRQAAACDEGKSSPAISSSAMRKQ